MINLKRSLKAARSLSVFIETRESTGSRKSREKIKIFWRQSLRNQSFSRERGSNAHTRKALTKESNSADKDSQGWRICCLSRPPRRHEPVLASFFRVPNPKRHKLAARQLLLAARKTRFEKWACYLPVRQKKQTKNCLCRMFILVISCHINERKSRDLVYKWNFYFPLSTTRMLTRMRPVVTLSFSCELKSESLSSAQQGHERTMSLWCYKTRSRRAFLPVNSPKVRFCVLDSLFEVSSCDKSSPKQRGKTLIRRPGGK